MAKLWGYVFVMVGLMALFFVSGLTTSEGTVLGVYNMTSPEQLSNIKETDFFDYFNTNGWEALVAALGGAILIGFFTKATTYQILSAGLVSGILVKFVSDIFIINSKLSAGSAWIGWIGYIILLPFLFGFVIAAWEWIGGRD